VTKLEAFRKACTAIDPAPPQIYDDKVKAMFVAFDALKAESDFIEQISTLIDDPDPMVRYMVAVAIRPKYREKAEAIVDAVADERSGVASTWAMTSIAARSRQAN
jgi:hypothetical protein